MKCSFCVCVYVCLSHIKKRILFGLLLFWSESTKGGAKNFICSSNYMNTESKKVYHFLNITNAEHPRTFKKVLNATAIAAVGCVAVIIISIVVLAEIASFFRISFEHYRKNWIIFGVFCIWRCALFHYIYTEFSIKNWSSTVTTVRSSQFAAHCIFQGNLNGIVWVIVPPSK